MRNKSNKPVLFVDLPKTAGGAISAIASMKGQASSGPLYMIHNHADYAADCMAAHAVAKRTKSSIRDAMLGVWYKTDEGQYHVADKAETSATPAKARNDAQKRKLKAMKLHENNINMQHIRLADCYRTHGLLKSLGFHVVLEQIDGSGTWTCQFRNEKGAGEQSNQQISADGLAQIAKLKSHNLTAKSKATDVLAKLTSKKGKGNKNKGNAANPVADIVNAKTGDVLLALDNRLSGFDSFDKDSGLSAATRDAIEQLYARCERTLSAEVKAKALARYDATAEAFKAKTKRTSRKISKVLKENVAA